MIRKVCMKRWNLLVPAAAWVALCFGAAQASAQFTTQAPTGGLTNLSILKPPAGSKVAIVVFEDLGCPHCAVAHPIELADAAKLHVPLMRYDVPIPSHIWTFQAAVYARYIQTRISPQLGEQYRTDIFAAQQSISSKDDLQRFTQSWLQHHGKQLPPNVDPDGSLTRAVLADVDLGRRINIEWTPTIIVISDTKQQVVSGSGPRGGGPEDILPVTQAALAQTSSPHHAATAPHRKQ